MGVSNKFGEPVAHEAIELLTRSERKVYDYVTESGIAPVAPQEIYNILGGWNLEYDSRHVRTVISNLKDKVGRSSIENVSGHGYINGQFMPEVIANPEIETLDGNSAVSGSEFDNFSEEQPFLADIYRAIFNSGRVVSRQEIWELMHGVETPYNKYNFQLIITAFKKRLGKNSIQSIKGEGVFVPSREFIKSVA